MYLNKFTSSSLVSVFLSFPLMMVLEHRNDRIKNFFKRFLSIDRICVPCRASTTARESKESNLHFEVSLIFHYTLIEYTDQPKRLSTKKAG